MSTRKWIVISGISWLAIGAYLMVKGLKWIILAISLPPTPMMEWLSNLAGSLHQGALALICASLLLGFVKGRMVLSKTVSRVVSRLRSQTPPIYFSNAYDRKYFIILGSMMSLGLLFRFLPIAPEIRGAIDVTIGSALMNGAMLYFRALLIGVKA